MMVETEISSITPLVNKIFAIEDITAGEPRQGYYARYRGQLRGDSEQAYDQLSSDLRSLGFTPLFRKEQGQHVILVVSGIIDPSPSNPWVNLGMFLLTVLSVLFVGAINAYQDPTATSELDLLRGAARNLGQGLPFAVSLLAILLAHEFGHYLAGRFHKTAVTLPYFLPVPLPPFGTLGAFIRLKEPPKNKRILLDIGIAGPLAGLLVAIPVLLYGLSLSKLNPILVASGDGIQLEGNSILYLLLKYFTFGKLLPSPASFGGLPTTIYWLRYFFTGHPLPIGGMDVIIHPVAFAGWAGLLVTSLNLIPAGQLDGGHLLYGLLGRYARLLLPFILVGLMILGLVWSGWWLWALLIFFLGRAHAEPLDQITPLDGRRKLIALIGLIIFLLVFTPVPMIVAYA